MNLQITTDQVLAMAPDSSSVSAGKKQANPKHWQNLGQNSDALWGECQGSALYHVRINLSSLAIHCSCPSRKQPCKHGLGLLLLTVDSPDKVPTSEPPDWVATWLTKQAAVAKRKETLRTKPASSIPSAVSSKAAEKRRTLVDQGVDQLDLWLNDLMRNGLSSVEIRPATFWEQQAKQMVDAQAPGLATRLRKMSGIPNASPDWTERLLAHCGQLALLTQSYRHLEQLPADLQDDVRQLLGWSLKEDEVLARGERVSDEWLFLGQVSEEVERGKALRTWLLGATTGRSALIVQFSIAGTPFGERYPCGASQHAELAYWPGAAPQRALIVSRQDKPATLKQPFPAENTIHDFLSSTTNTLARQPWQERFLCVLHDVIPTCKDQFQFWIRDTQGIGLPLARGEHWSLLAYSGGLPIDIVGEWDGETLIPLGIWVDDSYHLL